MKKKLFVFMTMLILVVALGACREEAEEAPLETSTEEVAGIGGEGDVSPINAQTWLDDFTIGSEINADGSVEMGDTGDDFAPGQMIYYAMEVGDAPVNAAIRAMVYDENEQVVHEEEKNVSAGQNYMTFEIDSTGWPMGDYRVDAWVGDERVNEQHFQIVEPEDEAM